MIPKNGFYIVNVFNTVPVLLEFSIYLKRESVTSNPSILKYNYVIIDNITFYFNELGTIISFQKIENVRNSIEAKSKLMDESYFTPEYEKLKKTMSQLMTEKNETDSSSICRIALRKGKLKDMKDEIGWFHSNIPNHHVFYLYLEALFIFQICLRIEEGLSVLLTSREDGKFIANLSRYMEELLFLERPDNYLVSDYEINTMTIFYNVWEINKSINHIKDRFNISVANSNLNKEYLDKKSTNLINLFLAGIAIFSATQSVSSLKKAIPFINEDKIVLYLSLLASSFIAFAIFKYYIKDSITNLRYFIRKYAIIYKLKIRTSDNTLNFFIDLRNRKVFISLGVLLLKIW